MILLSEQRRGHTWTAWRIADGQSLQATHSQLGYTCLHAAVEFGQASAVRVLLNAGALLDSHLAPSGRTPLHYAAQHGRVEIAKMLLEAGASKKVLDSAARRLALPCGCSGIQDLMQLLRRAFTSSSRGNGKSLVE